MKRFFRSNRVVSSNLCVSLRVIPPESERDPRAVRYFSLAASYNAVAAEMGYASLEHAVKAGQMPELLRRVRERENSGIDR